jgi:2-polyprenyl-3-methyl-5-hydroxy-6-metoxy-1,4-benzoquinol methylase
MDFADFLLSALPQAPVPVLEIGCGTGELALAIAERGHPVTAIDPHAPSGTIFRKVSLEDFNEAQTYGAVIANRSLHHIHDLDTALGKIRSLLEPNGVVILNEFAWDRMDEPTARWYLTHVEEGKAHDASLRPENFPDMWVREHADLHTSSALRDCLATYFEAEMFEWVPYIARHYLERVALEGEEAEAISQGRIHAIGFRYVGRKSPLSK